MSWRPYTLVCATVPAVIFVMMLFVPESPLYLVEKGDDAGAVRSLMRLRGATTSLQVENELASVSSALRSSSLSTACPTVQAEFSMYPLNPWFVSAPAE